VVDILYLIFLGIVFLCWGSFLNVVGHRLIKGIDLVFKRSHCPHCNTQIQWYDLIPVISYFILQGRCRSCSRQISPLYPFIELLSMVTLLGLTIDIPSNYFVGYFIFFSALIVSIRSDLETMLLSRMVTLYFAPLGWLCATLNIIPLSLQESVFGSIIGFTLLWTIAACFTYITGKRGLGEGDMELMACIGAFTGLTGLWTTLMIGSTSGALFSILYFAITKKDHNTPLPFGPFLALGTIVHVFMMNHHYTILALF
jgi:leader peptidase (prepilin peptidase) / N-methyltransferase